jgi:hypothetical protein
MGEWDERLCKKTHIPIDKFLDDYKEHERILNRWRDYVSTQLTKIETRYEGRISVATWLSLVAVLISIISLLTVWIKVR